MRDQTISCVTAFALVTGDLQRLAGFYHDVLGFALDGPDQPVESCEMALLGVAGSARRRVLRLGDQLVWIEQFDRAGAPYPAGSNAASLDFQHVALVVDDMKAAYGRLRGITPISQGGPQLLPASSGGVRAFKFRDPDGHPLELLEFPDGKMPAAWRGRRRLGGQIGLGIDHSAVSVADADASAAFYRALGLDPGARTLNEGQAQQCLDGLADAKTEVVAMKPQGGVPHLELLAYDRQRRRTAALALQPNDAAATRIVWRGAQPGLIRDPDGHLHQVQM